VIRSEANRGDNENHFHLVHLSGRSLNPKSRLQALLLSLIDDRGRAKRLELLKKLEALEGKPVPIRKQLRLPQGAIQAAVLAVMKKAKKPLRITEIHKLVEKRLKREVSYDTVCSFLTVAAKNYKETRVRRIGRGHYWLSHK